MKRASQQTLLDKCIRDQDGSIVLVQTPNAPIVGWLVFMMLSRIANSTSTKEGLSFVGTAFLFTWAYLEATTGVNYVRKLLGVVIIIAIVHAHF